MFAESSRVTRLDFNYFGLVNSCGGQSMTENKHMLLRRVLFLITDGGRNQLKLVGNVYVEYFCLAAN